MARGFHDHSPRAQVLVCAVVSVGMVGVAWRALIEPERTRLAERRTHLAGVQAGVRQAAQVAQRLPDARREITSLESALLQSTAVLPGEKDAQGVLRGLHGWASESDLNISSFTPKPGAGREQYIEGPVELALEGTYHDLARFFDRVASEAMLISVSNLQLKSSAAEGGPRGGLVQATCVATTFVLAPLPSPTGPLPPQAKKGGPLAGALATGGYDDGGRRDPFASLLAEKATAPATNTAARRPTGLAGVAVMDVAVRGIVSSGHQWVAIVAGPDGAMYLAHIQDRLHDGVVQRIDREAVVFLARGPEGPGRMASREVRKALRPGSGEAR